MLSSKKGAETSIYLASSSEMEGVTGEYFERKASKRSAEESYDENEAKALWDATCHALGLPS